MSGENNGDPQKADAGTNTGVLVSLISREARIAEDSLICHFIDQASVANNLIRARSCPGVSVMSSQFVYPDIQLVPSMATKMIPSIATQKN